MRNAMRVLAVCVVFGIGLSIAWGLLFEKASIDGYFVPVQLDELVQQAEEEGDDYVVPPEIVLICEMADSVDQSTHDDIELISRAETQECDYKTRSFGIDTWYAFLSLFLVAFIIFVGVVIYLMLTSDEDVPIRVVGFLLLGLFVAFIIGTLVGPDIWDKLFSSPVQEGIRYWRSMWSFVAIALGYGLALWAHNAIGDGED